MKTPSLIRTVTFGRHGQSEQNVIKPGQVPLGDTLLAQFRKRHTGDHRLSTQGINDGKQLGNLLRSLGTDFTLFGTSSYIRTMETLLATGLVEPNTPVEVSPLIDERYTGVHETLTHDEANARYPGVEAERRQSETRWKPEDGESMREVLVRTLLFMNQLHTLPGGNRHPLIIAHSRVMASYMWWAEQLEDAEVPGLSTQENGLTIANGQILQYGWEAETLRPSHKRSLAPGQTINLTWQPLLRGTRFTANDLKRMVEAQPPLLS